jgi:PilZ domain-containing protein
MTGDRRERSTTANQTVRVYGMRADGRPFSQLVQAGNLSLEGALLTGLEHELKVGDTIGLQYEGKKLRCRVVWVINAGAAEKNQAGIQLLSDQECPWTAHLSTSEQSKPDPKSDHLSPQNRRRFERHKLAFPLELRDECSIAPLFVHATDVGGNGCYVETLLPLPKGTRLKADFWIDSERISTPAIVRTCDGGVGMGIEFIGIEEATRKRLQEQLDKIVSENAAADEAEDRQPS